MPSNRFGKRCWQCRRPGALCYCHLIVPFASQPQFVILIHPRERRRATNSGRMAHLCLTNSWLFEEASFVNHSELATIIDDSKHRCGLLFPGDHSLDLKLWAKGGSVTQQDIYIILDGTWAQAKTMLRDSPMLQQLPTVGFTPATPSRFRIRRQPKPHCYGTLETIDFIIKEVGASAPANCLLSVFDYMVETQIACASREYNPRSSKHD